MFTDTLIFVYINSQHNYMTTEKLLSRLNSSTSAFDWMFNTSADTNNGDKLSLQGKSTSDCAELYGMLKDYLFANEIPFKIGTCQRMNNEFLGEQRRKAVTIYVPNHMDVKEVAEKVYSLTTDYKGWHDVKTPTSYEHYAGCVFIGNDQRNGKYVPAKDR